MTLIKTSNHYLPAEWQTQSAVMLTWPHEQTIWADTLPEIDAVFVRVAKLITERQKLIITCASANHQQHVKQLLKNADVQLEQVKMFLALSNDIWVRDHGPLTTINAEQKPLLLDFIFNGWGEKYPAENDNLITFSLHAQHAFGNAKLRSLDMVLEGGAIEVDGQGILLTTSKCLLSPSRNPTKSKDEIAHALKEWLGIKKILWLDHGYLAGDDTDSHIDTLARFTDGNTICYVSCNQKDDEHYAAFKAMEEQLKTFTNLAGHPYRLVSLPFPKARYAAFDGRRLPATYANFLIINHAVLVPTYDDPSDQEALAILAACFPDREIIGVNCLPVIEWYGSLHCMTMQLPEGVLL